MADNTRAEEQIEEDAAVIAALTPCQRAAMLRHAARLAYATPLPEELTAAERQVWHEGLADAAYHLTEAGDLLEQEAYGPPQAAPEPQLIPWMRLRAAQAQSR